MKKLIPFLLLLFTVTACGSKPPTEGELNSFIKEASNIYNVLVIAQNENRDLTVDEDSKYNSFEAKYGPDSPYYKSLDSGKFHEYQMITLGLSLMELNQGSTMADISDSYIEEFRSEQEKVKNYFNDIDSSFELVTSDNSIGTTTEENLITDDEDAIDEVHVGVIEGEVDPEVPREPFPDRLMAAKERLAETYPDSFSTQETLFESATEDYYTLQELWDSFTDAEKSALKSTNNRLQETYYDSPSTHLSLLESEIEAYRNLNN